MKNFLSSRLLACCDYIKPGAIVADVGCDHGYLGIYLLKNNIAKAVLAGDVNEGPLQSAVVNAEKYGVSEHISFFLSDGLRNFPREFDTMVCAGMGADTMISILDHAQWLKSNQYTLILQCQSKTHCLRKYLTEQGYCIQRETVLRDGRFLYTVMEVTYAPGQVLTPGQCYFPPALLKEPSPELTAYYQQTLFRLNRAVSGQGQQADPIMAEAYRELSENPTLKWLQEESL